MKTPEVTIIPTGAANTASVMSALRRAGASPRLAQGTPDILQAERIILPGVGNFGTAMERLEKEKIIDPLLEKFADGTPILAICLGMQLLFTSSDESPGVAGLSILEGNLVGFPSGVLKTHVGWNSVESSEHARFLRTGDAYFTHSYRLLALPVIATVAMTYYQEPFVSAFELGNILACQFHPELSGKWGLELLRRWIEAAEETC
jgi:imidazole glycerol phosphate synthase glutamine amidotransferase subunit